MSLLLLKSDFWVLLQTLFRCCRLEGSRTTRPVSAASSADGAWRVGPSLSTQTTEFTVSATSTGEYNNTNNTGDKRWNQTLPDRLHVRWVTPGWSDCPAEFLFAFMVSGSELLCVPPAERRYCPPRWAGSFNSWRWYLSFWDVILIVCRLF